MLGEGFQVACFKERHTHSHGLQATAFCRPSCWRRAGACGRGLHSRGPCQRQASFAALLKVPKRVCFLSGPLQSHPKSNARNGLHRCEGKNKQHLGRFNFVSEGKACLRRREAVGELAVATRCRNRRSLVLSAAAVLFHPVFPIKQVELPGHLEV